MALRRACVCCCHCLICITYVTGRYQTTAEQDEALIADSSAKPRKRVAARLIRIEKKILNRAPLLSLLSLAVLCNGAAATLLCAVLACAGACAA